MSSVRCAFVFLLWVSVNWDRDRPFMIAWRRTNRLECRMADPSIRHSRTASECIVSCRMQVSLMRTSRASSVRSRSSRPRLANRDARSITTGGDRVSGSPLDLDMFEMFIVGPVRWSSVCRGVHSLKSRGKVVDPVASWIQATVDLCKPGVHASDRISGNSLGHATCAGKS